MVSATPNCLGVIPARAGSRGIPGKNSRLFLNRPLVEWSILSAIESNVFQTIVVTTDCPTVSTVARKYQTGLIYPRPAVLCGPEATTAEVISHAVDTSLKSGLILDRPDYIFVLEPTSPGRRPVDITSVLGVLEEGIADSVASISSVPHHYHPTKQMIFNQHGGLESLSGLHPRSMIHRRQELSSTVAFDGVIFAVTASVLKLAPPTLWGSRVHGVKSDPAYVVDLDESFQWELAERQLAPLLLGS